MSDCLKVSRPPLMEQSRPPAVQFPQSKKDLLGFCRRSDERGATKGKPITQLAGQTFAKKCLETCRAGHEGLVELTAPEVNYGFVINPKAIARDFGKVSGPLLRSPLSVVSLLSGMWDTAPLAPPPAEE